jgi:hypothetical protein
VGQDRFDERHQRCCAGANPIGRRNVDLDAVACIHGALAVQWQMQAVPREQHVREQPRASPPARDRMRGRRRLRFGIQAGAASYAG